MMRLPAGWCLSRKRVRAGYGNFGWLIHSCGWVSDAPVDLALTPDAAWQIIRSHACRPPRPASLVIHGHPCPRERL